MNFFRPLTLLIAVVLVCAVRADPPRPNVVLIFTDDQGYGDLGCFGGETQTPRIDRMAAEGLRLTNFYVAAPLCTPSRAALMTGSYPQRVSLGWGSDFPVLLAADPKGLHPNEVTIAEVLRDAGYATGIFGKWHLGDQPEFLPTRQGFDEFFGIPYSHDIHPANPNLGKKRGFPPLPLMEGERVVELEPNADELSGRITDRAVAFIEAHRDQPFFLYVPHHLPHKPLHVADDLMSTASTDLRDNIERAEADGGVDYPLRNELLPQALLEIDRTVGAILDALKRHELDENTLVIFTSDNGPAVGSAGPLRGHKNTTWEGGMRMPTVVRWTGTLPEGEDRDAVMTTMDLLPTIAGLAGAELASDRVIDGRDFWPVLANDALSPHDYLLYHRFNELEGVRSGDWKLRIQDGQPVALFDLGTDPGERLNVIDERRGVADRLFRDGNAMAEELVTNRRPAGFVDQPRPLTLPDPGLQD